MSCGEPHETDCGEVLADVFLYLDGEVNTERRDRIRMHLDECSPCLRKFGIEREVRALVARCCGNDTAPETLRERVVLRLREVYLETTQVEYRAE
ncbi:MAG TPA: mycothiol system anti-sigma-R factor [Mycobacteriales bacterium]|jgi:mycothiol system anti-sigma-R factor|nr:mycothiol system anti-sigma-R factor [Mycobacteriales bacterium]